jgi:hypothetical protein
VCGNIEEIFAVIDAYKIEKAKISLEPVQHKRDLADTMISQIGDAKVAEQLCATFNCKLVAASWGDQKCRLMSPTGRVDTINGPNISAFEICTRTGAGDAWTSAIVHEIFEQRSLPSASPLFAGRCHDYLRVVLRQEGATPGATLELDKDEENPPQNFFAKLFSFVRHWVIILPFEHAWGALLLFVAGVAVTSVANLLPLSEWLSRAKSWMVAG